MPAEETYIAASHPSEHKKPSPAVLNLVKPTALEELCRRVADRNVIRDFHIWVLAKIMTAYSYMRCRLNAEHITIRISEINCMYRAKAITLDDDSFLFTWQEKGYFKAQIIADLLSKFDIPSDRYQDFFGNMDELIKKLGPLAKTTLRETLWDPEKREIDPEKLKEYIAKYTWAFPPNTAELLEEMIALPEMRREFEETHGVKLIDSNLAETECSLVETV